MVGDVGSMELLPVESLRFSVTTGRLFWTENVLNPEVPVGNSSETESVLPVMTCKRVVTA